MSILVIIIILDSPYINGQFTALISWLQSPLVKHADHDIKTQDALSACYTLMPCSKAKNLCHQVPAVIPISYPLAGASFTSSYLDVYPRGFIIMPL